MSRRLSTALWAILVVGVSGCGGSDETARAPAAGNETNASQSASADQSGAAAAVTEFLNSFRDGDDEKTERMLTKKARQEAAAMDLVVAPPGTDTAEFKLGRVAFLPEDRAAVACDWTDLNDQMEMQTVEYVWMLRREPQGWRIAGVAIPIFEGEPPLQLDFEDLKQMQEKLRWVHDERLRRAEQAGSQAQRPENSKNSVRR